jgi:hypothetical protein
MTDVPAYLLVLFGVLFVSVLVWFWLVSAFYRRLASNHPNKYREMGEPGLISNNRGPRQSLRLMKFVFSREDRLLNDPQVSQLTAFMFVLSICMFVVLLFAMIKTVLLTPGIRGS